jgi:hypothetical protein
MPPSGSHASRVTEIGADYFRRRRSAMSAAIPASVKTALLCELEAPPFTLHEQPEAPGEAVLAPRPAASSPPIVPPPPAASPAPLPGDPPELSALPILVAPPLAAAPLLPIAPPALP